jgi:hypothetical protein
MRLENLEQHCHSQRTEDTNPASFVARISASAKPAYEGYLSHWHWYFDYILLLPIPPYMESEIDGIDRSLFRGVLASHW